MADTPIVNELIPDIVKVGVDGTPRLSMTVMRTMTFSKSGNSYISSYIFLFVFCL